MKNGVGAGNIVVTHEDAADFCGVFKTWKATDTLYQSLPRAY